jgi:chromate transporter
VVGVILNLALFFGYHVLWPQGFSGAFDWPSAVLAIAAAVALFKYKRNVIHVIAVSGLMGVCIRLLLA